MTVVFRTCLMLAVVSAVAGGQGRTPPVPPTPPTPPVPARPAPAPAQSMRPLPPLKLHLDYHFDLDRVRAIDTEEIRRHAAQASREALEASRVISREALELAREQARVALEDSRVVAQQALEASRVYAPQANGLYALSGQVGAWNGRPITGPSFQSDPADSLFRRAKELLNSGDQRAAAQRFKELQDKYPSSQYVPSAMYFQAFALYRSGTDAELREAVAILERFVEKYPNARFTGENDYPADARGLATRIRGTLAQRGDAAARQELSRAASAGQTCDREDMQVKKEALSALWRVDQAAALPRFESVLARRDECSLELRRYALQIVTQRGDDKAVNLLLNTAKSDPSTRMRVDAVSYVSKYPSDEVLTALESIARTEENEEIRLTAARSLVGYPSPRARTIVRTLVEDNTVSDNLRCNILARFTAERGSADDATWLRASFAKANSVRVKSCLVTAVGNIGGAESQRWLMDLSTSETEPASIRDAAFRRISQSMTIADLSRTYDNAGNRPMRQRVVHMLNQRKEPEALDKLIDIVKKGSDPTIRTEVLNLLSQRGQNDPKIRQMLLDIIDK